MEPSEARRHWQHDLQPEPSEVSHLPVVGCFENATTATKKAGSSRRGISHLTGDGMTSEIRCMALGTSATTAGGAMLTATPVGTVTTPPTRMHGTHDASTKMMSGRTTITTATPDAYTTMSQTTSRRAIIGTTERSDVIPLVCRGGSNP